MKNFTISISDDNQTAEIEIGKIKALDFPEIMLAKFCKLMYAIGFTNEEILTGISYLQLSVDANTNFKEKE